MTSNFKCIKERTVNLASDADTEVPSETMAPAETRNSIPDCVVGGKIREASFHAPGQIPVQGRVSKSWNELDSSFSYYGNCNKLQSLWSFLHLVVTNPETAQCVRQLTLVNRDRYKSFRPEEATDLDAMIQDCKGILSAQRLLNGVGVIKKFGWAYDSTERIYCQWLYRRYQNEIPLDDVMAKAGFDRGLRARAKQVLSDGNLAAGYMSPLVALIIAYCPNVHELTLELLPSARDPWFDLIMASATGKSFNCRGDRPLQKLKSLSIVGSNDDEPSRAASDDRPFHLLPLLEEFTVVSPKTDLAHGSPNREA
ncbi:uncharacterized protein DSM5745_02529 [Aspergillus mulundensis]|uniref:Uncharacterized protein n=1 Tax=Aspergillus mulundensis TaxID=1810919 RepID=A0A3D8SWV1_9EURO|nr:hypothetical protein DSM5745_02529 [Aspergillus mulundensis]RDW90754.1 hypothetical protein DSM5745_02529 [Aspergillus mulundensis]